jgi:16S rRNA (cytidine1402-2'-O)-methyltransferase
LAEVGVQAEVLESGCEGALARVVSALAEGEVAWMALGMDEWSGPAHELVRALLERGVELVAVPGGSSWVAGLVASGLPADRFTALGLLPRSPSERLSLWSRFAHESLTLVCEVCGEDLAEALAEVWAHLGDRPVAVYQAGEVWRGTAREGAAWDGSGRVVLAIAGAGSEPEWTRERVQREVQALLDAGASPSDTAREVARRSRWPRRQVYELVLLVSRDEP